GKLVEPRDRRDRRSPTDIDEDAISAELYSVHRHSLVSDKAGMAFVNRAAFQCFDRALDALPRCPGDSVLACLDGPHIDSDRTTDGHAVITGAAREKGCIGACHQCFGGRASRVNAGAAEVLSFDDGNLLTGSNEAPRQRRPGLSCPDYDRIMITHGLPSIRSSSYSAAIARSGIASCKMTPSIGSNFPCHGDCLSARIVAS